MGWGAKLEDSGRFDLRRNSFWSLAELPVHERKLSLSQKCYCLDGHCGNNWDGFAQVAVGWAGLLTFRGAYFCWLANPLLWWAWIKMNKNQVVSIACSVASTALCLSFFGVRKMLLTEAGNEGEVTGYKAGYWLWLASSSLFTVGNAIAKSGSPRTSLPGIYLGDDNQEMG